MNDDLFAPPSEEEAKLLESDPLFSAPSSEEIGLPASLDPTAPEYSKTETFVRSAAQVPTMGFADELVGGAQALGDIATSDSKISDLENLYTQYRDIQRRKNEESAKQNPKTALAGSLAGGAATAMIPGLNVAKVGQAAALGATAGLGGSEADLLKGEYKEAAKDAAIGGALGGVAQKFVNKAGGYLKNLKSGLTEGAESAAKESGEMAYNAMGASVPEMQKMQGMVRQGDEELSNLVKKYVQPSGGPKKSFEMIQSRIDEIETLKTPLFQQADDSLNSLSSDQINKLSSFDLKGKLNSLAEEVALKEKDLTPEQQVQLADQLKGMFNNYTNPLKAIPKTAEERLALQTSQRNLNSLSDLDKIKKELGEELGQAGFKKAEKMSQGLISPNASLEAKRSAYDLLKNQIEQIGDTVGGDLGSQIKKLNKEESLLIGLRDTVERTAAKESTGQGAGPGAGLAMHLGAATLGGALGGPAGVATGLAGAAAGLAGKKAIERSLGQGIERALQGKTAKVLESGAKNMAKTAEALAPIDPFLQKTGSFIQKNADAALVSNVAQRAPGITDKPNKKLAEYDTQELSGVAQVLNNSGDSKLQTYGNKLQKALETGDMQSKNAAIFLIMQNKNAKQQLGLSSKE